MHIVFACDGVFAPWNPEIARTRGVGGSEIAVIEVTKRLAAKGYRVQVFTQTEPGVFEGVEYLQIAPAQPRGDVFVSWRSAELLTGLGAEFVWSQDTSINGVTDTSIKRLRKAQTVFAVSDWHAQLLSQQYGLDNVVASRNGIDFSRFEKPVARNPHRIIVSSSPDRGLFLLLDLWPHIRQRVPDAELWVFYGFEGWDALAGSDMIHRYMIDRMKRLLKQPGIKFFGKRGQDEIAQAMLSAGVWAHVTWFPETSCIGAMEAQAAGCRIVSAPIAALRETIGKRGILVPGDLLSPRTQIGYLNAFEHVLTSPEDATSWALDREKLRTYARENFGWDAVADQWETKLKGLATDKKPAKAAAAPSPPPEPPRPPPAPPIGDARVCPLGAEREPFR